MAAFALIGLASNVLQFIQVGTQLALEARELYKSASGSTAFNARVEADTENLKLLLGQIQDSTSTAADGTKAESQLLECAKSCDEVADQLLDLLTTFKFKNPKSSLLRAIQQAVYNRSTHDQVTQLQKRLQELQSATMVRFLTVLRDGQSAMARSLSSLATDNQILQANTTSHLDSIHRVLIQNQHKAEEDVKATVSLIEAMRNEAVDVHNQQKILKCLKFPEIEIRHESIKESHAKTFKWILDQHEFARWLEIGDGIYWIRGKAGSGKSTLMRFLIEDPKTAELLSAWAGRRKLVLASHFFWKSGTQMQKSLAGLLRTLLFHILRQIPSLIEKLFPLQWKGLGFSIDPPSSSEIIRAITALPLEDSLPIRFCFFIDGLDEYTTGAQRYHGDFQELIQMLEALSSSSAIKICVSSRPWTPFERAFGNSPNKLRLEDLTKDDIRLYVLDKFKASPHFQELASVDPRCNEFSEQIVYKAQGVFLWVFLVIESLLSGVSAADDFDDLQKRLDSIPADLEDYFKHILQTIEPVYWEQTSRILKVTADAEEPLPLLGYDFLDRERQNPNYALALSNNEVSGFNIEEALNRAKVRLNSRCRDLLDVVHDRNARSFMCYKVEFLHRTVRDFFMENDFFGEMIKSRQTIVDSLISLCRMLLALVKMLNTWPECHSETLFNLVGALMHYVHLIEIDFISSEESDIGLSFENSRVGIAHELLDEVNRAAIRHAPIGNHWTNLRDSSCRGLYREYGKKTFLALTIEAKLLLYVTAQLDANPESMQQKEGRPLLDYALRPTPADDTKLNILTERPDAALVKLLLSKGADPNEKIEIYEHETPWCLFLPMCAKYGTHQGHTTLSMSPKPCKKKPHEPETYKILHLMISNGADWRLLLPLGNGEHGRSLTHCPNQLGVSTEEVTKLNALLGTVTSEASAFPWRSWLWGRT